MDNILSPTTSLMLTFIPVDIKMVLLFWMSDVWKIVLQTMNIHFVNRRLQERTMKCLIILWWEFLVSSKLTMTNALRLAHSSTNFVKGTASISIELRERSNKKMLRKCMNYWSKESHNWIYIKGFNNTKWIARFSS